MSKKKDQALPTMSVYRGSLLNHLERTQLLLITIALSTFIYSQSTYSAEDTKAQVRQYTYSWSFHPEDEMQPRGGTTQGPPIELNRQPSRHWINLQETGLTKKERDRRAILAMAGPYRASFEFIETIGYSPSFTPARPYQSWTTEYVYVLQNEPDLISLQHIMVIRMFLEDQKVSEPMVMKHWRQDWKYQDRYITEYVSNDTWETTRISRKQAKGTWSQAVFQVDDSPRYESYGKWHHGPHASVWESAVTRRPLPRRENSIRSDYSVLEGTNRHTVIATGWLHEQDNQKLVVDRAGYPDQKMPYLAREAGLNRYERIMNYDFSAGDSYWKKTQPFWQHVRKKWEGVIKQFPKFGVHKRVDNTVLFMAMFQLATESSKHSNSDNQSIDKTIDKYVYAP
ncbi:MAG: hypothetical protein CMD77_06935 [Gammaproteobacteria bacterium]|nr:hypothetical protein [Gammaproteobacteria bacterium]